MTLRVKKVAVLNDPVSGDVVSSGGIVSITGLPQFKLTELVMDPEVSAYQAEVRQIKRIAIAATLAAGTSYAYAINPNERDQGWNQQKGTIRRMTPSTFGGLPDATNKHNLYCAWAYAHNNRTNAFSKAYPVVSIALSTVTGTPVAGDVISDDSTGATGVIVSYGSSTAVVRQTSLFVNFNGGAVTCTGSGATATGSTVTLGVGMDIIDDAGYYPEKGKARGGATAVLPIANVLATDITTTTAAVYSQGTGQSILDKIPVSEYTTGNFASGDPLYANLNQVPVAGSNYNHIYLTLKKTVDGTQVGADATGAKETLIERFLILANPSGVSTGYSAFLSALNALV